MDSILGAVHTYIHNEKKNLVFNICRDYNLDVGELLSKYIDTHKSTSKGRKKKQVNTDDYIETEELEYNGMIYLVDKNNNVYTSNIEQPELVGQRLVNGAVKFFCR